MDFDCDFDAPMFVDFQNLEGDHQEREQAEAYFEVNHEPDIDNQLDARQNSDVSTVNHGECDTAVIQGENWKPQIPANMEVGNDEEQIPTDAIIRGEKPKGQGMEDIVNKNCPTVRNSQVSTIVKYLGTLSQLLNLMGNKGALIHKAHTANR